MNRTARAYSFSTLPALPRQTFKLVSIGKRIRQLQTPENQSLRFGDYTTSEDLIIGVGSCSKVYKGKNSKTGEEVALKIIDIQKASSKVQKRFVKNEIYCLKQLRRSNCIIHLKQIIYAKKNIVIVTELCKQSLSKIMRKHSKGKEALEKDQAFSIFQELVQGYSQMRHLGLVHRDIKPANIFIDFDGHAKLGDLGFATSDSKLAQDRFIKAGSPLYMAPQIFENNSYSSKGDIWAMGIVLLEMLIGDLPWIDASERQLYKIVLSTDFTKLIPEGLEEKWKTVILRCLAKTAANRWEIQELMHFINPQFRLVKAYQAGTINVARESFDDIQRIYLDQSIITESEQVKKVEYKNNNKIQTFRQRFQRNKSKDSLGEVKVKRIKTKLLIGQKLKADNFIEVKLNCKELCRHGKVKQQQTSKLNLARLAFKVVEGIQKAKDNIHFSFINFKRDLSLSIASFILKTLREIKELQSYCDQAQIQSFKGSKQQTFLLQMLQKYQKNYRQYFQLKLQQNFQLFQHSIDLIVEELKKQMHIAREHAQLILIQMKESGLQFITDDQICRFMQLIECFAHFCKYLKLYSSSPHLFARLNRISEVLRNSEAGLALSDVKRINQMIEK